jgi:hypothetical protein
MTITERIKEIKSFIQDECWYITKHTLNFSDLCYATQIVEDYQKGNSSKNFADFFNQEMALIYGISPNHRMTNNCYYLGLLEKTTSEYKDAKPTDIFFQIKRKCQGNFKNTESYNDLMINQIEKLYLTNEVDRASNSLRKNFKIHPAIFLAKVLVELGRLTENYSITLDEFYKYVGTSLNYNYYLSTVSLIIESRNNSNLNNNLNFILDYYNETKNISSANFTNNRIHLLLKNLPYFIIEGSNLTLNLNYLSQVKEKLYLYEENYTEDFFTTSYLTSSNIITKSIPYNNKSQKNGIHQIIYFGSPGTGKSRAVEIRTQGHSKTRTTFHPETDYHSFVGSYKPVMNGSNIEYKFVPQAFTKAYCDALKNPNEPHFLIIEEINRGNCAQIFGDIFQCLDRDETGKSKYEVDCNEDLANYLKEVFTGTDIVTDKIILPNNLYILATMNTSDQSLFPMDSAFKRRWDWEFVPINYEDANSLNIVIGDSTYNWGKFIEIINPKIKELTGSEDKQLGNRFVNPNDGNITFDQFRSKVLFYLWSEVYKDEYGTQNSIFKFEENGEPKDFQFGDLYNEDSTDLVKAFLTYNAIEVV